jgi:hypothetical protein
LVLAAVLAVAAIGGSAWALNRPDPVPGTLPATAPAIGSCWSVDPPAAHGPFPWPGAATSCLTAHTAEVYHVGQVDHDLIRRSRSGGTDGKLAGNFMLAEVRRACGAFASTYLGGNWRQARVTVLAAWITPERDGFFGCALAETTDAGGTRFATRTATLAATAAGLAVSCVTQGTYTPCDQAHDSEFVGTYTLTPPDAPFDATAVKDSATKGCGDLIRAYLSLATGADRTDLSAGYVGPTTAQTWLGSDQTFACYAVSEVTLRGSIHSLGTQPLPH